MAVAAAVQQTRNECARAQQVQLDATKKQHETYLLEVRETHQHEYGHVFVAPTFLIKCQGGVSVLYLRKKSIQNVKGGFQLTTFKEEINNVFRPLCCPESVYLYTI